MSNPRSIAVTAIAGAASAMTGTAIIISGVVLATAVGGFLAYNFDAGYGSASWVTHFSCIGLGVGATIALTGEIPTNVGEIVAKSLSDCL